VNAKTFAKRSELEYIFYLLWRISRNDKRKVLKELMIDKHATMTATSDEIITKLVKKEAAIKRQNGLAPDLQLFAKKGGRGTRGGKVGRSPKRDKRVNKRDDQGDIDRKQKHFRKCYHCQRQWHTTGNCLSKQHGNPPKTANIAPNHQLKHRLL
jgi:hypothetical protein